MHRLYDRVEGLIQSEVHPILHRLDKDSVATDIRRNISMKLDRIFKRGSVVARVSGGANLNLKELFADFVLLQIPEVVFWESNVPEGVSKTVILSQIFLTFLLRHLSMRL